MEGGEGNVRKSRNFRCIIRCRNPLLCLIESGRSGEESGWDGRRGEWSRGSRC